MKKNPKDLHMQKIFICRTMLHICDGRSFERCEDVRSEVGYRDDTGCLGKIVFFSQFTATPPSI